MTTSFKTVILRFRDLGIPGGKTIQEHRATIQDNNYCWWGWWRKAGERVPPDAFNLLRGRASDQDGLYVYLFDSGSDKVYRARCRGLDFSEEQEISSPEREATPDYYGQNQFMAWFKFDEIEGPGFDEEIFGQLSYVDVPKFFESGENHFEMFADKIVFSARELRNQDRTIWFVRPREEDDKTNEIEIFGVQRTQPSNFPTLILGRERRHLLWLSDLHFGADHGFPLGRHDASHDRPLWLALEDAVKELSLDVAGVVVSGDVTTRGASDGFRVAQQQINELASKLRLQAQDFLICPGNHDFGFSPPPPNPGDSIEPVSPEAGQEFAEFYQAVLGCSPNRFFASARRFLLSRSVAVDLVALNSVTLQQSAEVFQGYGFIGPEQLRFIDQEWPLAPVNPGKPRPYRVLVLHHHLVPVNYSEPAKVGSRYSLTLDAEATLRWAIERQFDLVLHGHMHQPAAVRIHRPVSLLDETETAASDWPSLTLVAMGSTGANETRLGAHKQNTFGVLEVGASSLHVRLYNMRKASKTKENDLVAEIEVPRGR